MSLLDVSGLEVVLDPPERTGSCGARRRVRARARAQAVSLLDVSGLEIVLDTPNGPGRAVRGDGFALERVRKR